MTIMTNDNNLLLIISIGIVLYLILNINYNDNKNNYYKKKSNKHQKFHSSNHQNEHFNHNQYNYQSENQYENQSNNYAQSPHVQENYRDDHDKNLDQYRVNSPLLNSNNVLENQLIERLYTENLKSAKSAKSANSTNSTSYVKSTGSANSTNTVKSTGSTNSANMTLNANQKLFKTPPIINQSDNKKSYNSMTQQFVPNSQQQMYSNNNPLGNLSDKQNSFQNYNDQSYMLLPSNSMPDPKFKKVMPSEVRKTLTSVDLLPVDENKDWFQVPNSEFNLMQAVDLEIPEIKIGVDTVGQSRKNATYDLRVAPQNPKFIVSPWSNSTIEPDYNTKPLC